MRNSRSMFAVSPWGGPTPWSAADALVGLHAACFLAF